MFSVPMRVSSHAFTSALREATRHNIRGALRGSVVKTQPTATQSKAGRRDTRCQIPDTR